MNKHSVFKLTVVLLFLTTLYGCKKGDHDPFISFRSRKARVSGEWKLTKGSFITTGGATSITTSFDGTNKTENSNTTPYTQKRTFKKNGDYTCITTDNDNLKVEEGSWNFTGGVGGFKNKEQLVTYVYKETITQGSTTSSFTYTGTMAPTEIYSIDELRNKKMVLLLNGSEKNGTTGASVVGSLTFEQ